MTTATRTLKTSIGPYGHGAALKDGSVKVEGVDLEFIELSPITTAFRRMCRQHDLDISEMAITTYLTAKAYDLPFTAIPVFPVRQFHHGTTMINTKAGINSPKDLEGKKVGLRAYTVTGTVWARSVLATEHDVDLSKITWVCADEEHVAEFMKDAPPNVHYELGAKLPEMLLAGEIVGGIGVGRTESDDIKSIIPNAKSAQATFYKNTGVYPINHTIVVHNDLLKADPSIAPRLFAAFKAAKEAWMAKATPEEIAAAGQGIVEGDPLPYGIEANRKAIDAIIGHAHDQKILPRRLALDEVFAPGTLELS